MDPGLNADSGPAAKPPLLIGSVIVYSTVLASLVGIDITALRVAIGVVSSLLIGGVVVVPASLVAIISINLAFLDGRIRVDLTKNRSRQSDDQGGSKQHFG